MSSICSNCERTIVENFCSNCGQKKFKRIDKKYLLEELQYTVFHTNKGFLYSVKNILKNPGKTAKSFIDGNRVNHYKPILLVFLLSGISTYISFKILNLKEVIQEMTKQQHVNSGFMTDLISIMSSYFSIIMLLMIPIISIFTKLVLRKWGNNYYEHVVMNAYILAFYTLISIIIINPFLYIFKSNMEVYSYFIKFSNLLFPVIMFWFYKGFYTDKTIKQILIKTFLITLSLIVGYILFLIFVAFIGVIYAIMVGPQALQYIKPQ